MITKAQKAELRRRGVHPDVICELRPEDARQLLDPSAPIPVNAERSPEQDLQDLAAALARTGLPSTQLARQAQQSAAPGIEITAGWSTRSRAEATQADHQRCQQKAQQDRERERDQDVAPEVERAHDHHDCGQQRRR
jgi:hypothetical protein